MDATASGAYVRFGRNPAPTYTLRVGPAANGLIFGDVDPFQADGGWEGPVIEQLRFVPEAHLQGMTSLVIRAPEPPTSEGITAIGQSLKRRLGRALPCGAVVMTIGSTPSEILWMTDASPPGSDAVLLAQARAVELAAVIDNGRAHWQPRTFHYEVPSGEHRSDFVRLGDAFRSPRDAEVLATWLYPFVARNRAVLLDNSSLLPLLLALRAEADRVGVPLGPTVVRDGYPGSRLRDRELIELTVGSSGVLALLTVSSTGGTAESLGHALQGRTSDWRLEILVHRREGQATELEPAPGAEWRRGTGAPWLYVPAASGKSTENGRCPLCNDAERAPFVRIDPFSFANTSLPTPPVLVMPDPPHPGRTLDLLLELYDAVDGIGIDCDPANRTRLRRTPGRWGVRFYPHRLLGHPDFLRAAAQQLTSPTDDWRDGRARGDVEAIRGFDTIVFLDEDRAAAPEGFDQLCALVDQILGARRQRSRQVELPTRRSSTDVTSLAEKLGASRHILLLTVGSVSGGTLQEMLVRVHSIRQTTPAADYKVSAIAVHARPSAFKEWQAARSSFYGRLVALWLTYLPGDHPLHDEQRLFRNTVSEDTLSVPAAKFASSRRQWVLNSPHSDWPARVSTWVAGSGATNPRTILLCGRPDREAEELPRLLANSRFGQQASMIATLVGVGATLHRARLEAEGYGGPPGARFDLTKIPVAYFETPIIAAVLRWLRPYEAFWEYTGHSAEDVLREMWHRAAFEPEGSQALLLAELLLAAASGKLPRHTGRLLRHFATELNAALSPEDFAPIEIGLQLLEEAFGQVQPLPEEPMRKSDVDPQAQSTQ